MEFWCYCILHHSYQSIGQCCLQNFTFSSLHLLNHNRYAVRVRDGRWFRFTKERFSLETQLVLAAGLGNLPTFRIRTAKTSRFGSKPDPKRKLLPLGRPIPDPYSSTCGFCRDGLDLSVPISRCAFLVSLFIVAFWYATVQCKILTLVNRWLIWMNWLPWWSKQTEIGALPHPENERRQSVKDC